jgi:hypothetical protein
MFRRVGEFLREGQLPAPGSIFNPAILPRTAIYVGHIFFNPYSERQPATGPVSVEATLYQAAYPQAPVIVEAPGTREIAHAVFADFIYQDGKVGVDKHNAAVIRLFTCGVKGDRNLLVPTFFDLAATHFKNGEQTEGVEVLRWSMVHFLPMFRNERSLALTYMNVYKQLRGV